MRRDARFGDWQVVADLIEEWQAEELMRQPRIH